ncbi:MAG TPA: PKD domain-containing protein [Vicinamibacterales bacterium]
MVLQVRRAVPRRLRPLYALLAAAAVAVSACDKAPLLAPGGTVIFLNAASSSVAATGTVDIIAVLLEQGTTSSGNGTGSSTTPASGTPVHNGTLVSFTSTIGRIEPAEARTENGKVTVRFIGDGRSGAATILAYSGGARTELTLNVGAAAAERIHVSAGSLGSTGGTTTVSATVEDASGNPLSGIAVQFSTTRGTLSANSAVTNSAGIATVSLTTSGEAIVTATAGATTGTVTITPAARSGLTLTPPATITASAPAQFTVGVTSGAAVQNVRVNFGDGTVRDLGAISGLQPVTHVYGRSGNFTVTATATMTDGTTEPSVAAPVSVGTYQVGITATPQTTTSGSSVSFTASVTPNTVNVDHYLWNFGDGSAVRRTDGPTTSHTFTTTGTPSNYTVTVTVVPVVGDARSNSTVVRVNP